MAGIRLGPGHIAENKIEQGLEFHEACVLVERD